MATLHSLRKLLSLALLIVCCIMSGSMPATAANPLTRAMRVKTPRVKVVRTMPKRVPMLGQQTRHGGKRVYTERQSPASNLRSVAARVARLKLSALTSKLLNDSMSRQSQVLQNFQLRNRHQQVVDSLRRTMPNFITGHHFIVDSLGIPPTASKSPNQ